VALDGQLEERYQKAMLSADAPRHGLTFTTDQAVGGRAVMGERR